ncbi:hypothetical protein [Desulfuromonas thiophila]|uniref:hypothetical protein n=1 Tax=Desulfuromonas thiophila TaxID=57664 RepID=UPI0024A9407D|nr:hypothetical protein [Desulfuromonas thiophila]
MCALLAVAWPALAVARISPSQVLVLYNADWRGDEPLTAPGPDSLEIAEHYVRMHTEPATGEKPFLLGLHCAHGIKVLDEARHLDASHLAEASADNRSGVVFEGRLPFGSSMRDDQLRDSRLVEFVLPGGRAGWQLATLQMKIIPAKGDELVVVKNGLIEAKGKIAGNAKDDWTIRLDAQSFAAGAVTLEAACTDVQGKTHRWTAEYVDRDAVALSATGRDGKRDDQHFIEDVAEPVKAFLESPLNARPDGTLLKDHILFIVVCYGLPRTAIAPAGIARGISPQPGDHGAIIDFGQRLQLLYYDEDAVMGKQPKPYRFAGKEPFTDYLLRAPQAWPLHGQQANPFLHPLAYQPKPADLAALPLPLTFCSASRRAHPGRQLYFVSRLDGINTRQARSLIDRACYASEYGIVALGQHAGNDDLQDLERVGRLARSKAGQFLWQQGLRQLYYGGAGRDRLRFLHLPAGAGFYNTEPVYLPGGIGATVISHNGWAKGEMLQDLAQGVTATAGAAQVYRGAPHIHSQSWWDDELLYALLWRGLTLGEAWLANQVQLGWITTFVGDPLMRWAGDQAERHTHLTIDQNRDVVLRVVTDANNREQVWLQVDLRSTAEKPRLAQLQAVSAAGTKVVSATFDACPAVCLGEKRDAFGEWTLTLMTPFGTKLNVAALCQ